MEASVKQHESKFGVISVLTAGILALAVATSAYAQAKATSLGSVRISRAVTADGKPLPAGTYSVRLTDEKPAPVVGQTLDESRWVEFVQGGQVKGREIATVLTKEAVRQVKKSTGAAPGSVRVETLKGNDYVRVWINHGGHEYLIHLQGQ
jgi:hypothetical protein